MKKDGIICCNHCGNPIPGGWEQAACHGDMTISIPSQSWSALFGNGCFDFDLSSAINKEESGAQNIKIRWGYGLSYELCQGCHCSFVRMLGTFLKEKSATCNMKGCICVPEKYVDVGVGQTRRVWLCTEHFNSMFGVKNVGD